MISASKQPPPFEFASLPAATPRLRAQWAALTAGATAFFCMLPYPAYAVGNASAVQMGNICVAVACLPLLWTSWREQSYRLYLVLLAPLVISALVAALSANTQASMSYKATTVWAISLLAMLVAQMYAPQYALQMLSGIAVATLLHAAIGAWQWYAFSHDQFPLVQLYVNPSFLSVQENADTIARWTKRPFGLFPEPSAMSSSLSPWVLIWAAVLSGVVQLKRPLTRWHRVLFAAATAGGLGLIILSRSGQTVATTFALMLIASVWLVRARATQRTITLVIAAAGVALPLVGLLALRAVQDRIGGGPVGNSSWEERATSLVTGFRIYADSDIKGLIFGLGPGLASHTVNQQTGLEAVWSVLLNYLYDTGFIGAIAASCVAVHLCRNWRAVEHRLVYAAMIFSWLVGVTLTTSYDQLLPQWLALGILIVWPRIVQVSARRSHARVPITHRAPRQVHRNRPAAQSPAHLAPGRSHAC